MANKISSMGGMPIVKDAFATWQNALNFVKITQVTTRGIVTQNEEYLSYRGSIQPLRPEDIVFIRDEGQRSWQWLQIHVFEGDTTKLKTNDRILYNGLPYKVMGLLDYRLNGYIEYHILEDWR